MTFKTVATGVDPRAIAGARAGAEVDARAVAKAVAEARASAAAVAGTGAVAVAVTIAGDSADGYLAPDRIRARPRHQAFR